MVHLFLHFLVPFLLAVVIWRKGWFQAWLLMLCAFVIDLDHLLADPVYDPERCSIGFHPLHSEFAIAAYCLLMLSTLRWPETLLWNRARTVLLGVIVHLILDAADCLY